MAAVLTDTLVLSVAETAGAATVLIKRYCAKLTFVQHIDAVRLTFLVACLVIGSATLPLQLYRINRKCGKSRSVAETAQADNARRCKSRAGFSARDL